MPPSEAREFCDWLDSPAAARLEGNHFSVLALGDRCAFTGLQGAGFRASVCKVVD